MSEKTPIWDERGNYVGEWDGGTPINVDSFPVFDNKGKYIGEWPETSSTGGGGFFGGGDSVGDGGTEGCLIGILLAVVGFIVFGLLNVVTNGFREARAGNWASASLYFAIPFLLSCI